MVEYISFLVKKKKIFKSDKRQQLVVKKASFDTRMGLRVFAFLFLVYEKGAFLIPSFRIHS